MYLIDAGSLNGTLEKLGIRAGHETVEDALAALRRHLRGQGHEDLVALRCEDGVYVYPSREDAERDPDGSRALAVVSEDEEAFETSDLDVDLILCWAYFPEADQSEEKVPPRTLDGYEAGNYFDASLATRYPSREAAVAALKAAYRGPDRYGVGLDLDRL